MDISHNTDISVKDQLRKFVAGGMLIHLVGKKSSSL